MNLEDIVLWFCLFALTAMAVAFTSVAWVMLGNWRYLRRSQQVIDDLERSRQALMNMEPITVHIGHPLYDWEQESVS